MDLITRWDIEKFVLLFQQASHIANDNLVDFSLWTIISATLGKT